MDNLVQRINELSKKSKSVGLTDEEKLEQQKLRQKYISGFRNNLKSTLDNVVIVDKHGNKSKLKKTSTPKTEQ